MELIRRRMWLVPLSLGSLFLLTAYISTTNRTLAFDKAVLNFIHQHSSPVLDAWFTVVTNFGDPKILPAMAIGLALVLIRRKLHSLAGLAVLSLLGTALLSTLLKIAYERIRPELWAQLISEPSFSFPSGHAMTSMTVAAIVVYATRRHSARNIIVTFALVYLLVVGVSRLYLGVHYPTDVIGGWLASLTWCSLLLHAYTRKLQLSSPSA